MFIELRSAHSGNLRDPGRPAVAMGAPLPSHAIRKGDGRIYNENLSTHQTLANMPRRQRAVFSGVAHHITQRRNNRQHVFFSSDDRRSYLELLSHYAARSGTRVIGYCLMTNHVHLVAVPEREDSFVHTLRHAHSEYALAHNRADGRSGHLWQNRFLSCLLDCPRRDRATAPWPAT